MKSAVIYIHGKGGNAAESEHYKPLFPDSDIIGLDYKTFTPWETGEEIRKAIENLKQKCESIILIANSIGAFFSMNSGVDDLITKAYFISPIVDMEQLLVGMMKMNDISKKELKTKRLISTSFGEELSWDYLCYVREHPIKWTVSTAILYGSNDNLTPYETIKTFSEAHNATLTLMQNGKHWFHTKEQMCFLDEWILPN